jgi:HSP20 family protein
MIRDLMTLQDRMNRLFEEAFPTSRSRSESQDIFTTGDWVPAIDIYEDRDAIRLKADLPGIDPNKLEVRIEDNRLFLKGERTIENETNKENYYRVERAYGTFSRSFVLPRHVDADKIEATYRDGVLNIVLPKREDAKPKQIRINTEEQNRSSQKVNVR